MADSDDAPTLPLLNCTPRHETIESTTGSRSIRESRGSRPLLGTSIVQGFETFAPLKILSTCRGDPPCDQSSAFDVSAPGSPYRPHKLSRLGSPALCSRAARRLAFGTDNSPVLCEESSITGFMLAIVGRFNTSGCSLKYYVVPHCLTRGIHLSESWSLPSAERHYLFAVLFSNTIKCQEGS